MTRREHNEFWKTRFDAKDLVPLRPADWADVPRTAEGRIGYDVRTEYDDDCLHCRNTVAHDWVVHDAQVYALRISRVYGNTP